MFSIYEILAISLEVDEMVSKMKGRHDTSDDFIRKRFEQWLEWRDTILFLEEAYTKQSTRIEDYVKQIEELKKKQQQSRHPLKIIFII